MLYSAHVSRPFFPLALALALVASAVAGAGAQAPDPLLAVGSADPLELARVVDALGDDAIVGRLSDASTTPVRLAAVRACAWLHAPELALSGLVLLAGGRDPDLAPAAALALLRIAESLDRAALDAREDDGEAIRAALEPLATLAADETARLDVRRAASVARSYLEPLVSAPSGEAPAEGAR